MQPPSQKNRRIGFWLEGGPGFPARFDFAIRPEDLTVTEPSRLQAFQTLEGGWVDSFDRGLATITLSGHNGWRGGFLLSGEDMFYALRETVYTGWHSRRRAAAEQGQDPSAVQLNFVDTLDSISAVVVPKSFTLRRSRSSPLIMKYQVVLIVIGDDAGGSILDQIVSAITNPLRWIAGVTGLGTLLATADSVVRGAANAVRQVADSIRRYGAMVTSVLGVVNSTAQEFQGLFSGDNGPLHAAGLTLTGAARNAYGALAADPSLSTAQRGALMQAASDMADAECTIANSFNTGRSYPDFESLFGASNCSSTGGGRPISAYDLSQTSPLAEMFPSTRGRIAITPAAATAISSLRNDPLALIGQPQRIAGLLDQAAAGVTIA